jgi:hypothetical protein
VWLPYLLTVTNFHSRGAFFQGFVQAGKYKAKLKPVPAKPLVTDMEILKQFNV